MESEGVRVRLVFEDRHVLSKAQRSEGLKRSWLLLKPQHQAIADVSTYLIHIFDLFHSCPNGILLSMDGFVLPPFESTSILKNEDVISVKKKGSPLLDIVKVGGADNAVEVVEIVEKQPLHTGVPLLANKEFEKETRGYQSETEEDEDDQLEDALNVGTSSGGNAASKKRKASEKLKSPKRKKQCTVVPEDVDTNGHTEQIEKDGDLSRKNLRKKEKVSNNKSTQKIAGPSECSERSNDNVEATPSMKRNELQESGEESEDVSPVPEGTKKVPSRSARRKKAKRQWLREMAKIGKKEVVFHPKGLEKKELHWKQKRAKADKKEEVCQSKGLLHWKQKPAKAEKKDEARQSKGLLHWKQAPEKDLHSNMTQHEQPMPKNDAEDNIVPIVIRPGHIRFEPLEDEHAVQQTQVSVETFQWNGITSKKKGQKWGTEKISYSRRDEYKDLDNEYSEELITEKEIPVNDAIDFDKLPPLPSWPKEGDLIAYRLLELSSTWTPELSAFRVGKISWYNSESSRTMLMPVPEYPIFSGKSDEDATVLQQDNSLYKEDGSLEIDFSSLVDVRIVKQGNSDPAKAATGKVNEGPSGKTKAIASAVPSNNDEHTHATTPVNGQVNIWDQFSEALIAKKTQLSQENGWTKESSARSAWSSRALRGSALGPTMSLLRSKNEI